MILFEIIHTCAQSSLHCVGDVCWEVVEGGRGMPVLVVIISGGEAGVYLVYLWGIFGDIFGGVSGGEPGVNLSC